VQTTFLRAFSALQRGVEPEYESAWLYKIAHNVCLSRRLAAARRSRVEAPRDLQEIQDSLPAPQRGGDELIRLDDALAGMPERLRTALLLREWQGLSYQEIADRLEISHSAVETLIFRARRRLAQALREPIAAAGRGSRRLLEPIGLLKGLKSLLAGSFGGGTSGATVAAGVLVAAVVVGLPQDVPAGRDAAEPARAAAVQAADVVTDSLRRRDLGQPAKSAPASPRTAKPARAKASNKAPTKTAGSPPTSTGGTAPSSGDPGGSAPQPAPKQTAVPGLPSLPQPPPLPRIPGLPPIPPLPPLELPSPPPLPSIPAPPPLPLPSIPLPPPPPIPAPGIAPVPLPNPLPAPPRLP
jgi:RNA polymerase sigma factor (sigma-70 family)